MAERVAVVGLGYVGLPVAIGFGAHLPDTVGFDIDASRVDELKKGHDRTAEFSDEEMKEATVVFTSDVSDLKTCTFFIVCVPTPITKNRQPDLSALRASSLTVAKALKPGDVVVYESTVYPGVTEEFCGPILEQATGLRCGVDFHLGYLRSVSIQGIKNTRLNVSSRWFRAGMTQHSARCDRVRNGGDRWCASRLFDSSR